MATATKTRLVYENLKPNIGARILNTKEELLSGDLAGEIKDLIEQKGVLVFPKIGFTDAEQVAFTSQLGTFMPEMEGQDVYNISLDPEMNANRDYLKGSLYWHADGTMNPLPIGFAVLSSRVLPTWGGNTEFCNTYAAYEALPQDIKDKIADLKVMHSAWTSLFYYDPEPEQDMLERMMGIGDKELPVVWNHKSGRKSLVLGCTAHHVIGLAAAESAEVIHGLRDWATGEAFSYSHEWEVGDCVMWDNTGTMHRAEWYDPTCGRMMHRTKLEGEEPFE